MLSSNSEERDVVCYLRFAARLRTFAFVWFITLHSQRRSNKIFCFMNILMAVYYKQKLVSPDLTPLMCVLLINTQTLLHGIIGVCFGASWLQVPAWTTSSDLSSFLMKR